MKLSTKGRYAVMAVVDLAHACSKSKPADSRALAVSLGEIAARQGISRAYLEQLFVRLRKAGLVESQRGAHGGYRLARSAESISIADIVGAVDEQLRATRCSGQEGKGCLLRGARCMTHDLWSALGRTIHDFLSDLSVADVVNGQVASIYDPARLGRGDIAVTPEALA